MKHQVCEAIRCLRWNECHLPSADYPRSLLAQPPLRDLSLLISIRGAEASKDLDSAGSQQESRTHHSPTIPDQDCLHRSSHFYVKGS
jgi:hypothetical protein